MSTVSWLGWPEHGQNSPLVVLGGKQTKRSFPINKKFSTAETNKRKKVNSTLLNVCQSPNSLLYYNRDYIKKQNKKISVT